MPFAIYIIMRAWMCAIFVISFPSCDNCDDNREREKKLHNGDIKSENWLWVSRWWLWWWWWRRRRQKRWISWKFAIPYLFIWNCRNACNTNRCRSFDERDFHAKQRFVKKTHRERETENACTWAHKYDGAWAWYINKTEIKYNEFYLGLYFKCLNFVFSRCRCSFQMGMQV